MTQLVRDLMHTGLITCPADAPLGEVARRLMEARVHALVVVDSRGSPQGIISDFDLLAGEWLSDDPGKLDTMRHLTAGELMSSPPQTIAATASAAEAAQRLLRDSIHRLLVIQDDQAVGVISIGDLLVQLARYPVRRETVADVMSRGIVVCRAGTPLRAVARAMTERRSRSVVVVDPSGRPLGVVTGWDLLATCDVDCGDRLVDKVMHPPITVSPTTTLGEAIDTMIRHHIHRLVVVDPDRPDTMPLGVISTSDIFTEMAEPGSVWQR